MSEAVRVIRGGRPAGDDAELRYLRRRGNRHVRKARLTRALLRWAALGAAHLAIAAVLLYAAVRVFLLVTRAEALALTQVEIEGAERASPAAIRARLAPYFGRNLLELDLGAVAAECAADPWALAASARRVFPDTLRLRIVERSPRATALIAGVPHVVDATGFVIGPSGPGLSDDLPVLTGLDGLTDAQLIAALARGVGLIERLRAAAPGWLAEVSEIDIAGPDRIVVRTIDPGPLLLLDPSRVERNLREYLELRREVARRVGPMLYVDLRWEDHITVMPAEGVPVQEES
jgi:cell division protein FtsQ